MSAFKDLYPKYGFSVNMKLRHMSQFLAEKIESGDLKLKDPEQTLTYQDPCRLGRHMGIYDEPRKVLQANGSNHFTEMKQSNKGSLCCGVSAWMNCDTTSKSIQKERLKQAKDTGADVLAVACPKCQIHLVCTMKDQAVKDKHGVQIRDISAITLNRIK
ncbi:MAG: (Fe-S)-binding protein [Candidatus Marinimicrobia bacterium]|nr:(Fe-S)-binding protein [Candidatus Neomarinimicrobiota bacterium]